jgi:transcription initiation factor TFIID subunit 5
VATGSADKTVRLWEVHSGECVRIFTGHSGSIYALAFSPDGRLIASAGEDRSICLWDIGTGGRLRAFTGHTKCIWSVDFSAEGSLLASGSADETVRLWDVNRARGITPPDEHEDSVAAAIQMTTPSETSTSALLKRSRHSHEASEALLVLPTLRTPVYCVSFTNRNLLLASGPARPPPPSQPKQQ